MGEDLHNVDDLFRKALDEHADVPSQNVWENIDKKLDKKKVLSISEKYRKLKWVAAALLIFSVGMAMYTWHTKMRNKELVQLNNAGRKIGSEKNQLIKNNRDSIANNTSIKKSGEETKTAILIKEDQKPDTALAGGKNKIEKSKHPNSPTRNDATGMKPTDIVTRIPNSVKDFKTKDLLIKVNAAKTSDKTAGETGIGKKQMAYNKSKLKATGMNTVLQSTEPGLFKNEASVNNERSAKAIDIVHQKNSSLSPSDSLHNYLSLLAKKSVENNKILPAPVASVVSKKKTSKSAKTSFFSATLFYSPDVVFSRVDNDRHNYREDDRNAIKSKENIKNASTVGVLFNYNTGRKISIQSGLTLSNLTINIQPKTIFARADGRGNINYRFNCSAGYSYVTLKNGGNPTSGDSIIALSSINQLQYMSVPVMIGYDLINRGKFTLSSALGIAANFLTKGHLETVIAAAGGNESASINHIEGLNKNNLTGLISIAAQYNLNKFLSLSISPVTRLALTAINNEAPVKTYINSFGLSAGVNIKL